MVTRYNNLSGVDANYIDGSFAAITQALGSQSVLVAAGAEKGRSNTPFLIQDLGVASAAFGKDSDLVKAASQVANSTDLNIFAIRVGGKQSHFIIEKDIPDSAEKEILVRISPVERGASSNFDNVKVAFLPYTDGSILRQRVVLFDASTENAIFDSEEILSIDDTRFEVELNNDVGEIIVSKTTGYDATKLTSLAAFKTLGEQDARGVYIVSELESLKDLIDDAATISSNLLVTPDAITAAATSSTAGLAGASVEGSSQISSSHCERFAAFESMYADVEDVAVDFMHFDKAYVDVETIPASGVSAPEWQTWDEQYLGTAHKATINGQCYVTMFASPDPLSADHVVAGTITASRTIERGAFESNCDVVAHAESRDLGLLLSLNDIRIEHGATSSVEEYIGSDGRLKVNVKAALTGATANVVFNNGSFSAGTFTIAPFEINTSTVKITIPEKVIDLNGKQYADEASMIADYTTNVKLRVSLQNLFKLNGDASGGVNPIGKAVLTHFDLTGELIPEEAVEELMVLSNGKYVLAEDAYAREVNFGHQAASIAYTSSTEYKSSIAVVGTTKPRGGRRQLNAWAGKAPEYALDTNGDLVVESNGTKFMGTKYLYGASSYRANENGNGLAYGGFIQTIKGFGIDSSDELEDERGIAVDLGKHLLVVGAHGIVNIGGNEFISTNLGLKVIEKLASLPINEEPIGPVNGLLAGVSTTGAINSRALLNDIALGRVIMTGTDGSIANFRTAALPSSDYTRVSTIRAMNFVLDAMRSVSLKYLGKAFSDTQLAALDTELLGTMRAIKAEGIIQDGVVEISASRLDRINGRLNMRVQMIPPLSIEAISIDLVVSAPQA
jgi:hypothetical protein